jgi:membrane-anchored protein YejM (alkaline phosphatase superfamily)
MAESFHAVDDMTWADRDQHHRLKVLLANLEAALEEMPATHSEDAQRITEMTEILVSESSRKSPHASYLKLGAEGLLEAASAIQDISPEAMHAASEIAQLLGPEQ